MFLKLFLNDILNNQSFFCSENNKCIITTISFCEINENKIIDNFDFSSDNNLNDKKNKPLNKGNKKIFDYDYEMIIEGLKEIQITAIEQHETLMRYNK